MLFGVAHAAQLTLTWTDASTNEEGFKLERKTGTAGAYGLLTSLPAETAGYVDATVTAGITYCYRVRAYNSAGDSAYSNEACAAPAGTTLYTVAVGKPGTGSGNVVSSPAGIDCGATCSASIASGTSMALSATASTGSTFTGWSGAGCNGTGGCAFVVPTNNTTVTATFTLNTYGLTVSKTGTGTGTVTSSPAGVNCGSTCSYSFNTGTLVTLTPTPAAGSTFGGWSGGGCIGTGACTVTLGAAQTVTATFETQSYALTVAKTGTGTGTVTAPGITCGTSGTDCSETYPYNTSVTLTAAPATGSTFTGWGGACTGTGSCSVSMTAAQNVTATFTGAVAPPQSTFMLSVAKSGSGTGIVASRSLAGINCGTTCSASYTSGAAVTLEAIPEPGSTFVGWSGACTGASSCLVNMILAQNVTAQFDLQETTLTVINAATDLGRVISSPTGVDCGTKCSLSVSRGATISLNAKPSRFATFVGWSGACGGRGTCTVSVSETKTVTATFKRKSGK